MEQTIQTVLNAAGREPKCRESGFVLASKRCAPSSANFGLINVQFAKRCIEHVPAPKEKAHAIEVVELFCAAKISKALGAVC